MSLSFAPSGAQSARPRLRSALGAVGSGTRSLAGAGALAIFLLVMCAAAPRPAAAQFIRPWTPPSADSLIAWAAEARARFQTHDSDTASGANYWAYDLVGRMGRRLLHTLGPDHWAQAHAIEPVLDSLGLDTEVAIDPLLPQFVLLVVRNPFRLNAEAVGFLYWFREREMRFQGVVVRGGFDPKLRVWWTARPSAPYECGILSRPRAAESSPELLLLHLNPNGTYWNLVQYTGNTPDFGRAGEAFWVDINGDYVPEIAVWGRADVDSSFEECTGCPRLVTERIFVRGDAGFELHDSRLLPSPYSTFVLFIRLLRERNHSAAARLLVRPAQLDEAVTLGWATPPPRGSWRLEYAEPDRAWPRWLAMRYRGAKDEPVYVVRFTMKDARWIIEDWKPAAGRPETPGRRGARSP